MQKRIDEKEELITKLFKDKPELLSLSRNPFTAALISSYLEKHNKLPENQSYIYKDFIEKQLNSSLSRPNTKIVNNEVVLNAVVLNAVKHISNKMYKDYNYGLEIPVNLVYKILEKEYSKEIISAIISKLKYSKIIRLGRGDNELFSFVHRRFHEYFVAINLIDKDIEYIMLESIPKDTKWRDSLIMYCELSTKKR